MFKSTPIYREYKIELAFPKTNILWYNQNNNIAISSHTEETTMNIQIISVGKVREKYLKLGIAEFEKRLQSYCKLQLTEVADEQAPEKLNEKDLERVKVREGERILKHIKGFSYVIALDIQGKQMSSEQFSKTVADLGYQGKNQLTFIIGGSNGLSTDVLKRANEKLSFSKMTFPHQMMKLVLLEQVYRAYKIQRREPYHK